MEWKTITAKYAGKCGPPGCGAAIEIGDRVVWAVGEDARCLSCGVPTEPAPAPLADAPLDSESLRDIVKKFDPMGPKKATAGERRALVAAGLGCNPPGSMSGVVVLTDAGRAILQEHYRQQAAQPEEDPGNRAERQMVESEIFQSVESQIGLVISRLTDTDDPSTVKAAKAVSKLMTILSTTRDTDAAQDLLEVAETIEKLNQWVERP